MKDNRVPGCIKYGCLGCASLIAIAVGGIFLISALQLVAGDREPMPELSESSHELPPAPPLPPLPPTADGDLPASIDVEVDPSRPLPSPQTTGLGVVELDLTVGEFTIKPGPAGEPMRVEADYDSASFELKEELNKQDNGDWHYKVGFGGKGGWLGMLMQGGANTSHNRVDITIPRGHPIRLVGKVGMGESKIDLGGLWVQDLDLELRMGEHFVDMSEPLPVPMDSFSIEASMGEVEIRHLGNASPASVRVDHGMGEMVLDLNGSWRRDAMIKGNFRMGEFRVWLPDNVRVDLERAAVGMGETNTDLPDEGQLPANAPLLTLDMSGNMGELRIER